jgi:hypothetical protein
MKEVIPGPRHHDDQVGLLAGRDKVLRAVQDVLVTVLDGGTSQRRRVASRVRLAESVRAEHLTGRHLGQILLLELFACPVDDRTAAQRVVDRHDYPGRGAGPVDLLEGQDGTEVSHGGSPVFLGDQHTHKTELTEFFYDLLGERAVAVVFVGNGRNFIVGEVPRRLLDHELFFCKVELQCVTFPSAAPGEGRHIRSSIKRIDM